MSYMHIDNLYRDQTILMFRECWSMEKVHGTSSHLGWSPNNGLRLSPGGVSLEQFTKCFGNLAELTERMSVMAVCGQTKIVVYGEAYGGRCQGMAHTYGKQLKFIVFEVKIDDCWLSVPAAADVAEKLGLEFVPYHKVSTDLEQLDAERDRPSEDMDWPARSNRS